MCFSVEFLLKVEFHHGLEEFLLSLLSRELQDLLGVTGVQLCLSDCFDLFKSKSKDASHQIKSVNPTLSAILKSFFSTLHASQRINSRD